MTFFPKPLFLDRQHIGNLTKNFDLLYDGIYLDKSYFIVLQ